jgi:hypothetical protein
VKVFISWSEGSKEIALALKNWLPRVLHSVEPFMSEKDVVPGSAWLTEISNKLQKAK